MSTSGKLIVFEGPDGVGKSTLAKGLVDSLAGRGTPCDLLAFPGREAGTLGRHVYDLHHDPGRFGVANIPPASLQLLHVAAHLDAITGHILPALRAGRWVVLDRFWWSTWVYGLAAGVKKVSLEPMLAVERPEWDGVVPMAVFLVRRGSPLRGDVPIDRWRQLVSGYNDLALVEQAGHAVFHIENEGTRDEAVRRALEALDGLRFRVATPARGRRRAKRAVGRGRQPAPRAADLFSSSAGNGEDLGPVDVRKVPNAFCPMSPAKPSEVYQTYWRFAAERQAVFFRRIEGVRPLTDDPILARYKFCNAYRASDRVSQYLVRNVIYLHDQSPSEIVFRTLLFKLFNKIETWERLERELGTPCYGTFEVERYAALLEKALAAGEAIYSAAYIMPSGSGDFEDGRKHRSHLRLLEKMMQDRLAGRLGECRTMRQAFDLIRTYPMIGDFLAYQYVTDINYSTVTDFSEMQFVVPGPGARDGIRKCFRSLGGFSGADIIRWVADQQERELSRLGISFRSLWGRPLQLIDCQNLFCETGKYARLAHPQVKGISGRTRIKQTYRPHPRPIAYWYPPKWGLNEAVAEAQAGHGESEEKPGRATTR